MTTRIRGPVNEKKDLESQKHTIVGRKTIDREGNLIARLPEEREEKWWWPDFSKLDDEKILSRFKKLFGRGIINLSQFQNEKERVKNKILGTEAEGLLKGPHVPIIMPQVPEKDLQNFWRKLELLVEKSYARAFPLRKGPEALVKTGQARAVVYDDSSFEITHGSRYENLLEKLSNNKFTVGFFFPRALYNFPGLFFKPYDMEGTINVYQLSKLMRCLPEFCVMSGFFDTMVAAAMYPDYLFSEIDFYEMNLVMWGTTTANGVPPRIIGSVYESFKVSGVMSPRGYSYSNGVVVI